MKKTIETDLLVVGGGAAGLCAAAEAAGAGAKVTVIESDLHPGGQLVKQTHKFFGSKDEYAGTRGYKIADILLDEIASLGDKVEIRTNTTVTGYYPEEGIFTAMKGEEEYYRIKAKKTVVATGAQERLIPFPNNDLPGVYGAGAVQTLMNVYGVVPGKKVVMVGAGNIGLIVSYQLRQAGVEIAAIVEAMPKIGGYWVHAAKIRRLGIPILLRHTIVEAIGDKVIEGAVIQELDDKFQLIGEPMKIDCDVICMAVGLTPTTELFWQAGAKMQYCPQLWPRTFQGQHHAHQQPRHLGSWRRIRHRRGISGHGRGQDSRIQRGEGPWLQSKGRIIQRILDKTGPPSRRRSWRKDPRRDLSGTC